MVFIYSSTCFFSEKKANKVWEAREEREKAERQWGAGEGEREARKVTGNEGEEEAG